MLILYYNEINTSIKVTKVPGYAGYPQGIPLGGSPEGPLPVTFVIFHVGFHVGFMGKRTPGIVKQSNLAD